MRVLSMDGGGIRGVDTAVELARREASAGRLICDLFDLVVGTSTGGILACCAAAGIAMSQAKDIYANEGRRIFSAPTWRKFVNPAGIVTSKYPADGRQAVLDEHLGSTNLSQARVPIVVTSFDISTRQVKLFKSRKVQAGTDTDQTLSSVAMATSAAPTFFPPYGNYIDGGVWANNPALVAIAEALTMGARLEEISVLAVGTGTATEQAISLKGTGGLGWLEYIASVFMDSGAEAIDYIARIGDRYDRVQWNLGQVSPAMDDASPAHIDELLAALPVAA